jgi:adenylate cyclase
MQQLTLFKANEGGTLLAGKSLRIKKRTKTAAIDRNRDLWTQETEVEKELALFFLDIRNFTSLAEKHQAYNVIHIVKKLFATFQNIIRIHRGRIIETSGDGFYATFGLDSTVKDAVNAAVHAGTVILETLENLNAHSFERNLQQRIEVGIGVHVGKVACDTFRLNSKDHFVVMGYPVNVASRIQAATKELNNNFLISSAVFGWLDNSVHGQKAEITLKGVTGPCELYMIGKAYQATLHPELT